MPQNKEDSTQKKNGSNNIVVSVSPKKPKTFVRKNVNKKKLIKKKLIKKQLKRRRRR